MYYSELLYDYITKLESVDKKDTPMFSYLLNEGMLLFGLSDKDIAHEFGASKSTVQRWKNFQNAPHPFMRRPIYNYLKQKAIEKLEETKE